MHDLLEFTNLQWSEIEPRLSPAVRSALTFALEQRSALSLRAEQLRPLAHATGEDLVGILIAANELRKAAVGDVVTYVLNRNINFTNVCFVGCKFCAFSRSAHQPDAYFMTPEHVAERAAQAWERGATEVCIQGGLPRDLPPFYYRDLLRAVKRAVAGMHTHAFSPMEIMYGVELTGMSIRDYLLMLKDAGLDTLPGTAAEILDDQVRAVLSRNKLFTRDWCEIITTAHQCGIRTTCTLMYGHLETPDHWLSQLLMLRDIQTQTGGFTEFVPLGFVHQNTIAFQQGLTRPGPTLAEHLKIHALARIVLAGSIPNVQVSWVKLSREIAQLCLKAGANDYGGTLMDENISRLAGATSGEYLSPEEFQARIRELGRIPAERNTVYTKLRFDSDPPLQTQGAAEHVA